MCWSHKMGAGYDLEMEMVVVGIFILEPFVQCTASLERRNLKIFDTLFSTSILSLQQRRFEFAPSWVSPSAWRIRRPPDSSRCHALLQLWKNLNSVMQSSFSHVARQAWLAVNTGTKANNERMEKPFKDLASPGEGGLPLYCPNVDWTWLNYSVTIHCWHEPLCDMCHAQDKVRISFNWLQVDHWSTCNQLNDMRVSVHIMHTVALHATPSQRILFIAVSPAVDGIEGFSSTKNEKLSPANMVFENDGFL